MPCVITKLRRISAKLAIIAAGVAVAASNLSAQTAESVPLPEPSSDVIVNSSCECSQCTSRPAWFPRLQSRWQNQTLPRLQDAYWGYPENFIAEPFGASVYSHFKMQVDNATVAKLFLYRYDFQSGPGQDPQKLSIYGKRRLERLASSLLEVSAPLQIEQTGDASLDEARRQEVVKQLQEILPDQVTNEQVVLATPIYPGLRGNEALLIHGNMLNQTQGAALGGGGGGGGGGSGTSFGAPPLTTGGGSGGSGSGS